jgi:hypothetical protein
VARIFICYRRDDASGHAGRLRDALSDQFGAAEIFRDIETIGPGDDFVQAMSRAIASCGVFLAIIGRHWVGAAAPDGTRRLDDPEDHVRGEIAEALKRGVRVIPVLVQGARMPRVRELPESLKGLAARNALALDDEGWESDVQRLAAAIRRALPAATSGGVEIGAAPEPRGALASFRGGSASTVDMRSPLSEPPDCSPLSSCSPAVEQDKVRQKRRHPPRSRRGPGLTWHLRPRVRVPPARKRL